MGPGVYAPGLLLWERRYENVLAHRGAKMKNKLILVAAVAVVSAAAGSAGAAYMFPQGRFSGFGRLEWESSCSKPYFPSAEYAEDWQRQSVSDDYLRYTRCVADQFENDARYAQNRMLEAAEEELDKIKRDAQLAGWNVR